MVEEPAFPGLSKDAEGEGWRVLGKAKGAPDARLESMFGLDAGEAKQVYNDCVHVLNAVDGPHGQLKRGDSKKLIESNLKRLAVFQKRLSILKEHMDSVVAEAATRSANIPLAKKKLNVVAENIATVDARRQKIVELIRESK